MNWKKPLERLLTKWKILLKLTTMDRKRASLPLKRPKLKARDSKGGLQR
jgi:hypothetical protein